MATNKTSYVPSVTEIEESVNISDVPFTPGQFVISDSGQSYYDPTNGTSTDNRISLSGSGGDGEQTDAGGFQGGQDASATSGGAVGYKASVTFGGAVGGSASATYGGAVGYNASATTGGAVGYKASATAGGAVGGNAKETGGGFAGGYNASATTGGAVGSGASTTTGGAIGYNAKETAGGFAGGDSASATTGGAIGDSASATAGGAVGNNASATFGAAVGNNAKETTGGGAVGSGASAATGGAVGYNASATFGGGAVGSGASALSGGAIGDTASTKAGGAVGQGAHSETGGAVGDNADTQSGGAVGQGATSITGGAIGEGAKTGKGFAGGYNAKTVDGENNGIDAIQLGTGTNSTAKTLQVYNYRLMDASGNVPSARLTQAVNSMGSDFAESLEWLDGNPNNEDRRGLFVTLTSDENNEYNKIKLANSDDEIVGVVSSIPTVVGNSCNDNWKGKYQTDIFGKPLTQIVHHEAVYEDVEVRDKDEDGNLLKTTHNESVLVSEAYDTEEYILSSEYDPSQEYIPRLKRKEWASIGFIGQLIVVDDGTCIPGKKCKCGNNGVGTLSNDDTGYRVLSRIDNTHIKILLK